MHEGEVMASIHEHQRQRGASATIEELVGKLIVMADTPGLDDRARVQAAMAALDHRRRENRKQVGVPYRLDIPWTEQLPTLVSAMLRLRLDGDLSTREWLDMLRGLDLSNGIMQSEAMRRLQRQVDDLLQLIQQGGMAEPIDITPEQVPEAPKAKPAPPKGANGHANGADHQTSPDWHGEEGAAK